MNKKTAFITGITGMVGSHLAEYLISHTDWDIVGMVRWRSPLENLSKLTNEINKNGRIRLVYADLKDSVSINKSFRDSNPNYVFHLAAQSYPLTSFDSPVDTLDTNIQGTVRILEAVKNFAPDAIVHICASSEVFGKVPKDKVPIDEECNFHPASPYAISKIGTDLLGRYHADAYGQKIMTTRMFTHTGPRRGDVFAESSFAKQIAMIEKGMMEPTIKVGNLDSLRTFADVRDAVRAYYMLVTVNPIPGEYYNIGGTHVATIREMLECLINKSTFKGIKYEVEESRLRPIDADLQIPDTNKFFKHTGWETEIDFDTTMQNLLDYWREKVSDGGAQVQR